MDIYTEMQAVTADILAQFKQGLISYIQIVPGNGPVDNPGPSRTVSFAINGTATGVQFKYVQQKLAVATDIQIVAPFDVRYTPDMKGVVEIDGVSHKIVQIIKKPAAGTPVAYIFILRRGG